MSRSGSYWLKAVYRKEPIIAIALTAGSLDLLIGTVHSNSSLAVVGLAAAGGGLALTWWKAQRRWSSFLDAPMLYLPDCPSQPSLSLSKSQPSRGIADNGRD